jgi:hypothetical protein
VPVWATITTVVLAALIAMAMSAGVAVALAPRSVPPIPPVAVTQP